MFANPNGKTKSGGKPPFPTAFGKVVIEQSGKGACPRSLILFYLNLTETIFDTPGSCIVTP
jgi:hypothetical protein